MLIIGDLHISSRQQESILQTLKDILKQNSNEQNIVFLWDFVYHFSYDRKALLNLYQIFVELFEDGKQVFVLAGNHDRLWQHFVYHEAQKAFDIINSLDLQNKWKLYFITEPLLQNIEWEQTLFFPFMLTPKIIETPESVDTLFFQMLQWLSQSSHKQERISGKINKLLSSFIDKHKELTIIHHYYFNKIKFPWQKAIFWFKDIALSEMFLENPNLKFISGHLHQAFVYKNYVCTGSFRSTSPLETNQNKFYLLYDATQNKLDFKEISINPYLQIIWNIISDDEIEQVVKNIQTTSKQNSQTNSFWKTSHEFSKNTISAKTIITLVVKELDYNNINQYIPPEIQKKFKDIKLKKVTTNQSELLENFDLKAKDLSSSFSDRKLILKTHLKNQFSDEYGMYISKLQDLKVL